MTSQSTIERDFAKWLNGKQVGVVGLQRTGMALARELTRRGARVLATDQQQPTALKEQADELFALEAELACGEAVYQRLSECDLIVISPGVPATAEPLREASQRGVPVIGEIEFAYRLVDNEVLAVTATKGKSTTVSMVGAILSAAGMPHRVCGNIGAPLTGEIATLAGDELLVIEVSSFQLETIEAFRPRDAAVLNVASDHLDRHASYREYVDTKLSLLSNQTEEDRCLLCRDYEELRRVGESARAAITWVSAEEVLDRGGYVTAEGEIHCRVPAFEGSLCHQDDLSVLGRHNALNALSAALLALGNGVPVDVIRSALTAFQPVPNRLEQVATVEGITFWNDSMATTPFAAAAGLEAMPGPTVLILGGRAKTDDVAPLSRALADRAKAVVCLGESGPSLASLARSSGVTEVELSGSLCEAVAAARSFASAGDHVLLSPACASFDMFRDYADRGEQFRQCVAALRGD